MEYRILGPLEVAEDDRLVALGRGRQRSLLALLLLHANEAVPSERLIDELWGESPPPTANKTVQVYVSQLRKALRNGDPEGPLLTRGRGYVLKLEPGELDLERFERALADGRRALDAAAPEQAAQTLRDGLALWRGAPLADFAYEPFAQAEIARLEDLRLAAIEERVEADLELGRHAEVVGELEALVAEHPLRERLRGQLMLALYRGAALDEDVTLMATEGMFPVTVLRSRAGAAAEGLLVTLSSVANERLTGAGAEFLADFRRATSQDPCCYTVHVAQATHALLDAIAASDGSRRSVTRELLGLRVTDGVIGDFQFDENGDVSPPLVSVYRMTDGKQKLFDVVENP